MYELLREAGFHFDMSMAGPHPVSIHIYTHTQIFAASMEWHVGEKSGVLMGRLIFCYTTAQDTRVRPSPAQPTTYRAMTTSCLALRTENEK